MNGHGKKHMVNKGGNYYMKGHGKNNGVHHGQGMLYGKAYHEPFGLVDQLGVTGGPK